MSGGFGTGPFGTGPYGTLGGVFLAPPHPLFGGYGGSAYGFSPYGTNQNPRPPFPVTGGYGGYPYGTGPYGSVDTQFPSITSGSSLDGFTIEVFFDEEMTINTALLDPANYVFTPVFGAAPATALSVAVGVTGAYGATSVLITHTGTTLGGQYTITISGPSDLGGNDIAGNAPANEFTLLTKGEPPAYTIVPTGTGMEVILDFDQDMLPEAGFSPGIEDITAYEISTTYPVPLTVLSVTHPYMGDASQVALEVQGQTSAQYTVNISPADAIIWPGDSIPSADPGFTGTEVGTGTSIVSQALGLLMTPGPGLSYGWRFEDTSGRLIPSSSFRADVTLDVSAAVITPALFDTTFAQIKVSDGGVEFLITLLRVGGVDTVDVTSGVYTTTFAANWSSGETTISLVRNQKADIFTTLVNGEPYASVVTATPNGAPTISAGVELVLDPGLAYTSIVQLPLKSVNVTSTQTVFSAAWNFLHGQTFSFTGSDALTRPALFTGCGPLVKDWGDSTPATKQDVTVLVNDVAVEVADVNPYLGEITTTIPIPLMPPGTMTVETDYCWWQAPVFEFAGLNCEGQVLNKYELGIGDSSPRFPFGLVLGPFDDIEDNRPKPKWIGHRYLGLERAYTSMLNDPTTMILNENPHAVAREFFVDMPDPQTSELLFTGLVPPGQQGWSLAGADTGGFEDGTTPLYTLRDASSGSFGDGEAAVYTQETEIKFPSSLLVSAWFYGESDSVTYDGVWSGLGFGIHDNDNLYLVGCLRINDILHVGILTDPGKPDEAESWTLVYQAPGTVLDSRNVSVPQSALPERSSSALQAGIPLRFQIFEGSQVGTYEVEDLVLQTDGTATITTTTPFPADQTLFGNRDTTLVFESRWDGSGLTLDLTVYRLVIASDKKTWPNGFAQLFIGSTISGLALEVSGLPPVAIPPDSNLLLPTGDQGLAFFGSLSRRATNVSKWSFMRYNVAPNQTMFHTRGIVVAAEMNDLPDEDPNNIWFVTQEFGTAEIDSTADQLLLKAPSSSSEPGVEGTDLTYGYARIEPFLTREQFIDVDAVFQVETGTQGWGDAQIVVRDTERVIKMATLLYEEFPGNPTTERRQIIGEIPSITLSGLRTMEAQGWDLEDPGPDGPPTERVQGQVLTVTQVSNTRIRYEENFETAELLSDGRILEARLRFENVTTSDVGGNTNIYIGCDAGPLALPRSVGLRFRKPEGLNPARIVLISPESGSVISAHDFDWEDGEFHTYRLVIQPTPDAVTLVVDDTLVATESFTSFDASPTQTRVQFGFVGADTSATVDIDSYSGVIEVPDDPNIHRTLGVWKGGDEADINNWELPRTDSLDIPNSWDGAVIEEMDWRSLTQVRVHRDPTWGVTILRPDLPPPPYFSGDFATEFTLPSAGWINVEYRSLPRDRCPLGFVSFGALNPLSVTQQRWRDVRFRIFPEANEEFLPLPHAVLNQFNTIHSGEFNNDISVEQAIIQSSDRVTVEMRRTMITADRVFFLQFDLNGSTQIINPEFFSFDKDTQVVTIDSAALFDAGASFTELPEEHTPVTVSFAPGRPISKQYICSQPFKQSVTKLNDGTPPYPKSRVAPTLRLETFGSRINDPNDTLNDDPDFILNDPFRTVEFEDETAARYECLDFCEIDDGGDEGLLSTLCDDNVKGLGLVGFGLGAAGTTGGGANQGAPAGGGGETLPGYQEYEGLGLQEAASTANGACIMDLTGPLHIGEQLGNCILQPVSPGGGLLPFGSGGTVTYPVIGALVDPSTGTFEILYFDRKSPAP